MNPCKPGRRLVTAVAACWLCLPLAAQEPTAPAPKPAQPVPAKPQDPPLPLPTDQEALERGLPIRRFSLEDALRFGRANSIDLRADELVPLQAQADILGAEAFFSPELYGNVGYEESESPTRNSFQPSVERSVLDATIGWRQRVGTGGLFDLAYRPARFEQQSTSGAFPDLQYTSEWAVSYTQPLLRGAWSDYNLAGVRSAQTAADSSRALFQQNVQNTLLAITEAYWELAYARENYRVIEQALAVAREQLRITEERIRVRELAPRDRIADEAEVARRQEELILGDSRIRTREDDLRRLLLGEHGGGAWHFNLQTLTPIAMPDKPVDADFDSSIEVAMQHRNDLQAARLDVRQAEIDLDVARNELDMRLDLIGAYSSDSADRDFGTVWADAIGQEYPDWSLRLEFSIPLGNKAARARERRASLELERRRRLLYASMMDVSKQVRDAVRQLQTLAQSVTASGESVRLAQSNLETEQVKLRVGSSTNFEVQRRNQELREARSRHLRNQLDYRIAMSRLQHAQGILDVTPP